MIIDVSVDIERVLSGNITPCCKLVDNDSTMYTGAELYIMTVEAVYHIKYPKTSPRHSGHAAQSHILQSGSPATSPKTQESGSEEVRCCARMGGHYTLRT